MTSNITIQLNGAPQALPAQSTLVDALASLGIAAEQPGVAVALGLTVIRRAEWAATPLKDGDEVEVVGAAQGG